MNRRFWLGAVLLLSVCALARGEDPAAGRDAAGAAMLGSLAPLHLDRASGEPVCVPSPDHPLTVLLFVAPDCPVVNRYAPEINRLHEAFSKKKVLLYRVYSDPAVGVEAIRAHTRDYALQPAALLDPVHACARAVGATVTPEAVVLDRAGRIYYRGRIDDRYVDFGKYRNEAAQHDLRDAIEAALQGKTLPQNETPCIGCFIPMDGAPDASQPETLKENP
ncbi:MAG: redoxin domain-containing protein [Candidatus Hydrogenedentes bacterium]|nr:redoxin domain-containing protein [Candidatus Hydrogenedentota bacterium]